VAPILFFGKLAYPWSGANICVKFVANTHTNRYSVFSTQCAVWNYFI